MQAFLFMYNKCSNRNAQPHFPSAVTKPRLINGERQASQAAIQPPKQTNSLTDAPATIVGSITEQH